MATLTANLSSTALDFTVTGSTALAATGTDYRIDDEVVTLRAFVREPLPWSPRNRNRWNVSRGQAGTVATTHLAGADIVGIEKAVTTGTTLAEPDPFARAAGGAEQTVSLVGPFPIAFDDADADPNGNGLVLTTLEPGPRVIGVAVESVSSWDGSLGGNPIQMTIGVGGPDYLSGFWSSAAVLQRAGAGPSHGYVVGWTQINLYGGRVTGLSGVILAQFNWDVAPTHGTADIYVLLAEPSV